MQQVQPILQLSPVAKTKLVEVLTEQKAMDAYLRVDVFQSGGCACSGGFSYGMTIDQSPRPNDVVEEIDGIRVVTDKANTEFLRGSKIDYADTLQHRGFSIENPNVHAEACGCGGH